MTSQEREDFRLLYIHVLNVELDICNFGFVNGGLVATNEWRHNESRIVSITWAIGALVIMYLNIQACFSLFTAYTFFSGLKRNSVLYIRAPRINKGAIQCSLHL